MAKTLALNVIKDGPIKVSGATSVRYCGEAVAVETGSDVFLCRCGESKNAPFCDGNHGKTGFVGESEAGELKDVHVWEGKTMRTFFNPNACMHVFYCKPLKELRQQEIAGDEDAAAEIARVVRSCPSGALSYEAKDLEPPAAVELADIEIVEGGEVRVQCEFEINAELFERQPADRATLCRCGLSKSKPWCDGRHKQRKEFR